MSTLFPAWLFGKFDGHAPLQLCELTMDTVVLNGVLKSLRVCADQGGKHCDFAGTFLPQCMCFMAEQGEDLAPYAEFPVFSSQDCTCWNAAVTQNLCPPYSIQPSHMTSGFSALIGIISQTGILQLIGEFPVILSDYVCLKASLGCLLCRHINTRQYVWICLGSCCWMDNLL